MRKFPFYRQLDQMDCGPSCIKMIARYYGLFLDREELNEVMELNREGTSMYSISQACEKLGFRTSGLKVDADSLSKILLPCILHWREDHFVVLYKLRKNFFYIADPAHGLLKFKRAEFMNSWLQPGKNQLYHGFILVLQPTPELLKHPKEDKEKTKRWWTVLEYLRPYKSYLLQLALGLLVVSFIQSSFPFITQNIVDTGIANKDIDFIVLLLLCQLFLFFGKVSVELVRSWLILHLSNRISIAMLSDFFVLLLRKSLAYFDTRMTGDILQRINDHKRIEQLLTNGSLGILFSSFNLLVFSLVLFIYHFKIFTVFLIGSLLYLTWILLFMKKRRDLDYKRFSELGKNQSKVIEMVNGIHEIKLNGAERSIRRSWEHVQSNLYSLSIKSLSLEQMQNMGSSVINELKNIFILFLTASLALKGELSLGVMLAISYIIGQLNTPLSQLVSFIHSLQDARIAIERIDQVRSDPEDDSYSGLRGRKLEKIELQIKGLSYKYPSASSFALRSIDLLIPKGKTTAIVGKSGSGKTTLMKLLLKYYQPTSGNLSIGGCDYGNISPSELRRICGVVLQDGYIFNDTIEQNIVFGDQFTNVERLQKAIKIARIEEIIRELPRGLKSKIGMEGYTLSGGQNQRILIARAVYRDPSLFIFDEATSSLDAINERMIMTQLFEFMKERTAIIIAHRLSTVKIADQIVVMDSGEIVELGRHEELLAKGGAYFNLVSNQLELAKAS